MPGWFSRKRDAAPSLDQMAAVARRMAEGDLSQRFPGDGDLARDLNAMASAFRT